MSEPKTKNGWFSRFFSRHAAPDKPNLLGAAPRRRTKIFARLPSRYIVDVDPAVSVSDTYGMVRFTVHEATLTSAQKGREYFTTVSIGKQTFLSSDAKANSTPSATLTFEAGAEFVLQKGGASIARVAVFRRGKLDGALSNHLVAWCEVDLAAYFGASSGNLAGMEAEMRNGAVVQGTFELLDPESMDILGSVRLSGRASSFEDLEKQVWERLLLLADWDGSGALSQSELGVLMHAFGSDVTDEELGELFRKADTEGRGAVTVAGLAAVLSFGDADASGFSRLLKRCPVDGAELSQDPSQAASNLIYVWLALSASGDGNEAAAAGREAQLKAGYNTEVDASRSWALRLSEWASHPVAGRRKKASRPGGLRVGDAAAHILVFNRADQRVEEEALSPLLAMAMRTMYQSSVGRALMGHGAKKKLISLSISEGKYRDSPESAKDIKPFVDSFRGQIDVDEAELPLSEYTTFNTFFYRKLKPGSRPVANPEDPDVVVSAADCRMQVFESLEDATRFWIKGKNFSVAGLLADTDPERGLSRAYAGGSMAIFRLAPQDYHRFHSPVSGTVVSITDVPGDLLTVNPIAVNCTFCDVFTVNKRSIMFIDTTHFGRVAFVAIGATLVGSIAWSVQPGATVAKGDELGFFSFGGSTCIALFPDGTITWDADLVANGKRSLESLVRVGERVGLGVSSTTVDTLEYRESLIERTNTLTEDAGVLPLESRPELRRLMSGEVDALMTPVLEVLESGDSGSKPGA